MFRSLKVAGKYFPSNFFVVLQGLSGGIAIILSIPVTALLAVKLTKVKFKNTLLRGEKG